MHVLLQLCFATVCVLSACIPTQIHAQITPKEGTQLHYRIIGFSFPANQNTSQYIIEIAKGKFTQKSDFAKHIVQTVVSDKNNVIIEVPSFGSEYTWRINYKQNGTVVSGADLHHFATGILSYNGTNIIRVTPKPESKIYPDAYILIDRSNVIYDMKGVPVWYLPENDTLNLGNVLKISQSGTLTFLMDKKGFEIDYNGNNLWHPVIKNNSAGEELSSINCHHEFTKLSNGHYMTFIVPLEGDGKTPSDDRGRKKFFEGVGNNNTLAEFDKEGNIVWSWETSKYIKSSDLHVLSKMYPNAALDMHENAFFFDEKNNVIYIGMAGVSRIVKIKYPSGKVLAEYGNKVDVESSEKSRPDTTENGFSKQDRIFSNNLFRHQHSLKRSDDGMIYVYNNNSSYATDQDTTIKNYPQVVKMKETNGVLQKVWDFDCKALIGNGVLRQGVGGNIRILPNQSVYVSMSLPYSDLFILDSSRIVQWHATTERYNTENGTWENWPRYRGSIITRGELEQMIWNANK